MAHSALNRLAWLGSIHTRLDRFLYGLSTYALPCAIAIISCIAYFSWENSYSDYAPTKLSFHVLDGKNSITTVEQAIASLPNATPVKLFDTRLSETPIWFSFVRSQAPGNDAHTVEIPSRHALDITCWDAQTLAQIGHGNRHETEGVIASAKAGFALGLSQALTSSSLVCRAQFVGPARLTVLEIPAAELKSNIEMFQRNAGLLDGGLIVLAIFMLVTAMINRESTYVLFAAWLFVNLRVAALSAGYDFQWINKDVPVAWLAHLRALTLAFDFVLTVTLFRSLFRDDLNRLGYKIQMRIVQWCCAFVLPLAVVLPYATYLPFLWGATCLGVVVLVYLLARILLITRSQVAMLYGASLAITLGAGLYEVIAAALGLKGLIGSFNCVTAALSSSLLASLAVAVQMRSEHTEKLNAQAELRHNYEAMPIGLFTLDMHGRFLNANPALKLILNHDVMAREKSFWGQYFDSGSWSKLLELIHSKSDYDIEIRSKAKGKQSEQKRFLVNAIEAHGKIEGWLQDVTEKSKATEHLHFLAENDPLTKVYNRRGIAKMYDKALRQIEHGEPLALAYLDLDRFKLINDLYGHMTGDEVLRQVCDRIRGMTTGAQQIGRVGGDEFVIVMPDTAISSATWICRGIIDSICSEPYRIGDKAFGLGVSIGLIEVNTKTDIKDALANADRACREAKAGHHDGLVIYEKNAKAFIERFHELQLIESLTTTSSLDGLFLLMQPIMSLKAPHESLNFEVLLRMRDHDGSIIPAGRIISAAESSGRTGIVDRWVLSSTLAWLNAHCNQLNNTKFVCMNLSGASLNDEKFVHDVVTILSENTRVAHLLCMEITESVALHDLDTTRRFIDRVRSFGVKVALDDFGAGYTSFSYLKELPADVLKIDGSFVVNMNEHPTNVAIVQAIVNLAMNLGMKTIAEWAEDTATVQTLAEIGVDYVQGYAVARPQDPDRILEAESAASFIQDEHLKTVARNLNDADFLGGQQDVLDLIFPNSSFPPKMI